MRIVLAILFAVFPLFAQALPAIEAVPASSTNQTGIFPRGESPGSDQLLLSCPGAAGSSKIRRADRCTFIKPVRNPDQIIWKNMGNAQLNCGGSTTPTTVTLGGSQSFSTSTTVEASFGISFEGISIGGGMSTTNTETKTVTQGISYSVPPGRQAVYTVGYNFHSETGKVQVNYGVRVSGHYIWFPWPKVTKLIPDTSSAPRYQVHATKCGTDPYDLKNKS